VVGLLEEASLQLCDSDVGIRLKRRVGPRLLGGRLKHGDIILSVAAMISWKSGSRQEGHDPVFGEQ
jgi:hypothetical protein